MIPAPIWRCWTVPARVVRAVPRHVYRHVWRPVRHFAIHHAIAVGAAVVIPATVACILVPGWLAVATPGAVEGGGASPIWYGAPGSAGFGGVPEGGVAFGGGPGGEFGGCCGTEEERRHHHHHHHELRCERHPAECETTPVPIAVRMPEPSSLALFGFAGATLMWLRRPRVPPVTTLLPTLAQLERDIADARRDLGAHVVAIDPVLAEHGRRLAEEMRDE